MKLETTRFGEINIDENLIFTFIEPIVGYDDYKKFVLVEHKQNSIFKWLQSIEEPSLAFPVGLPAVFGLEYEYEIPDDKAELLGLTSVESLISLNIVTIPNNMPEKSTMNLLAPIIINAANKKGMQLILQGTDFCVREPLFKPEEEKESV